MAEQEKNESANVSIKLEGLRAQIEAACEKYPHLKFARVRELVVEAATVDATNAAQAKLDEIIAKAAAYKPFEL